MGFAVDFIESIGGRSVISEKINSLTYYLLDNLKTLDGIHFNKGVAVCKCEKAHGIISFSINNISSEDIADYLDQKNIYIRSGRMCTHNNISSIRVSLQIYNTKDDIDTLINALKNINVFS